MRRDISVRLLLGGYDALEQLREANGGQDWFAARLLGRRALVVRGEEGARRFYDPDLVTRKGAIPAPLRLLLFGRGAVHGMNGSAHRTRKAMFLGVVDQTSTARLAADVARRLEQRAVAWNGRPSVRLYDELVEAFGTAVIAWAGIEIDDAQARSVSHDLAQIVDAFGVRGTSYGRGYAARFRANRWARGLIAEVRGGTRPTQGTVLAAVASNRTLSDSVAAVELLNILRPTVAVAYFGAFAAHALDNHPAWKARLRAGDRADLQAFEHEIRRCYPFVPLLTGRLLKSYQRTYEANGVSFPRRGYIVLDVIGTNQDPRRWAHPTTFDPERFISREPNAYEYVPQGGGDPASGHRCPGEPMSQSILQVTIQQLAHLEFEVAHESKQIPRRRVPSLAPREMELQHVRLPVGTRPT